MFEKILVPLDGSSLAECVLPHLLVFAQAFESDVTLLRVLERPSGSAHDEAIDPLEWQLIKSEAKAYLQDVANRLEQHGLETNTEIKEGQAEEHIIEFVKHNQIDLIIMSSHGESGLSGWNISSVVQKTILRAYTSTLIVRAYQTPEEDLERDGYGKILAPLDGSQRAENVLAPSTILADFCNAHLLLSHLVLQPEIISHTALTPSENELINKITTVNKQKANQYLEGIRSRTKEDIDLHLHVKVGHSAEELHELVENEDVDLVVLSAHGQSGNPKWPYGSVALSFVAYGTTPLLIIQDISRQEAQKSRAELAAREEKGH